MKVLGIDTSTKMATCAVIDGERLLGEYSLNQDMSHSENLIPMISELLKSLNLKISDLDLYGVSLGPGSFTGLRIGIATTKAFAHAYDKPIVGVSTLEGLAFNTRHKGPIVPIIDGRRNRVYVGIYKWEKGILSNKLQPTIMEIESLIDLLKNKYSNILLNGNGIFLHGERLKNVLGEELILAQLGSRECRAASIAELALINRDKTRDNYYNLSPEYLRESQAERERGKKDR